MRDQPESTEIIELAAVRVQKKRLENCENVRHGLAKADFGMRVSVSMDDELYVAIFERARQNRRTVADEIRRILKDIVM